jgi:CBS domain containing-hemolysin-like protein
VLKHRYTSLPVVNRDGEFVGVVHLPDVLGKRGAVSMYVKAMAATYGLTRRSTMPGK